jgi:hypothetical protein
VRRTAALVLLAATAAACSSSGGRAFATYYDPQGLFRAELPVANSITVAPPQPSATGPGLLTGVIASPPQPSPSPSSALGAGSPFGATQAPTDQTIYEVFAYTTRSFTDLDQMTLYFLTGAPGVDVQTESSIQLASDPARLVVADVSQNGSVAATVAVALTLGSSGTGYVVAAIFPPDTWEHERSDFLDVIGSFRATVPPALKTYPLQPQAA